MVSDTITLIVLLITNYPNGSLVGLPDEDLHKTLAGFESETDLK